MKLRLLTPVVLAVISTLILSSTAAHADNELAVTHPTFYVIAPGSDASIAPVVSALQVRLQKLFDLAPVGEKDRVWVIPRLGWSTEDLQNQCKNDPTKNRTSYGQVLGGMILDGTNSYAGATSSYFLWVHGWTNVTTHAELVSCAPVGFGTPTITWVSDGLHGYSSRNGFPIATGAASALWLTSAANSETKSFALGATISNLDSTSSIPAVDTATEMHDAADRAANDLMQKLQGGCTGDNTDIRWMCFRMGLVPQPPPTPAPTPTPKPTESP